MPTGDYYPTTYGYANCTTSGTASATDTWVTWNDFGTSTAGTNLVGTFTVTATWSGWNTVWVNGQPMVLTVEAPLPPPPPLTPEQLAEQIAAQERYRQAAAERERLSREAAERRAVEQREAIAKAKVLLESMLTSEQIAQLAANKWFEVISQKGRRYRIHQGQTGNVHRFTKDGKYECRFCIHPSEYVPDEDAMLAQMLLLKTDEDAFVKIANRS